MRTLVPTHQVFNGAVGALTGDGAFKAKVGETVLMVHNSCNVDSRPHLIGGHGDYVWESSFTDPSLVPQMAPEPVTLSTGARLHVQKYEVTVAAWNTCHDRGGCALRLRVRPGQDAGLTPATGLSHADAMEYVLWINGETGALFRLPTASEWREIAQPVLPEKADPTFTDPSHGWASAYLTEGNAPRALKPQGSFSTSPEGISDLDGSVWEWTQDCYVGTGEPSPAGRCPAYFLGGENVVAMSFLIRDPARGGCAVGTPSAHLGLRLVSDDAVKRR